MIFLGPSTLIMIKKSNSRLYALRRLKNSGMCVTNLVIIYSTFIRSCIAYASPAWSALTKNQSDLIESIQRRAFRIIIPVMSYSDALDYRRLQTLCMRRPNSCESFINNLILNLIVLQLIPLKMPLQTRPMHILIITT